jgi:hypothetical protein
MKSNRILLIGVVLSLLAVMSVAAIFAQESTPEATSEPGEATEMMSSFADNRINGDVFLGGLAIFCEDEFGATDGNTFQNGGITVWGPDGQKYIELTAAQLRGDEEISQPPPTPDPLVTPMPEATMDASATAEPLMQPVLLARASTVNGPVWLFRLNNEDTFALQGYDNTGKFYTYVWQSCSLGTLDLGAAPFDSTVVMPVMEMTSEMTAEPTSAPTTAPEPTEEVTEAA